MKERYIICKPKFLYGYRLACLLLCFAIFVSPNSIFCNNQNNTYADLQAKNISIKAKGKTIKEIFELIEQKSQYLFVYYDRFPALDRKVTIEIKNKPIEYILQIIFADSNLSYEISGRQITVKEDNQKTQKAKETKRKIKGLVLDENEAPMPSVVIGVKASTRGVLTDIDGSFEIEALPNEILVSSYLGYETVEVPVGTQLELRLKLLPKLDELSEVTVVTFGTQKKESIIGAITTISPDKLKFPAGKLSTSLAGQMAGIVSVQRSGEPGYGADFWIRGISTFSAFNKPLVLVDGIERPLDLVDQEDIESFSILKDATATALYGVKGANGIVLVTTKKGKEGRFSIDAKVEFGLLSPIKMPKMANASQWIDYYNDINFDSSGRIIYPIDVKQKYVNGTDPDLYPNVDWMNEIYKKIVTNQKASLSISGGSARMRYYVAGSFYNENGIFNAKVGKEYNPMLRFSRYNFRTNFDIDITSSTKVSLNLSNQYESKNRPGNDIIWKQTLLTTPITTPLIYSDGTLAQSAIASNPWNILNKSGYSSDIWNSAQSMVDLTQDFSNIITKGLRVNAKFAWDTYNSSTIDRRKYPTTYHATGRDNKGELTFNQNNEGSDYILLSRTNSGSRSINVETSATYENIFTDKHRLGLLFLFNLREYTNNFPVDYIASFPNRNIGIAFRSTYSYKDRYFIEGNFGYNGSENFAPGKKFGFFPSIAMGYLISNEAYFNPIKPIVSLLKVKASYGEIGNDKIGGNRRFAFNSEMKWHENKGYVFGTAGQTSVQGLSTGHPGNPNVSWESAIKRNIGIEIGVLHKMVLYADWFHEARNGIFIEQRSVPSIVGQNIQEWVNLGKMNNQGIDGSLEYTETVGSVLLQAKANWVFNRSKKQYDDMPTSTWAYRKETGFVSDQQRGLVTLGLFKDEEDIQNSPRQVFGSVRPGDIKYRDINGDGIIDNDDQIAIGRTDIPEINYGFGISASWKGIDMALFFQGIGNVTKFIGDSPIYGQEGNIQEFGQIYADVAENRWSLDNRDANAKYPRMSILWNKNNNQPSTFYQRDMSFLRLKHIELGYTIPKKLIKGVGISSIRFYAQGVNLFTISQFKLWDPEIGGAYGNSYPLMRTISFGINISI